MADTEQAVADEKARLEKEEDVSNICTSDKPCLHDGVNNNTCYALMELFGDLVCPTGTSLEVVNVPVEEEIEPVDDKEKAEAE